MFLDNMRCSILKGFLMVLLTQHSTSEGMSAPIQYPTEAAYQDGQTFPQEPELPIAEIVPLVSTPSLKDVQQAMQEASEQVKGRGAEEVIKELLERVVEAALGQVEAAIQAKDIAVEKEGVEEVAQVESEAEEESETLKPPQEGTNRTLEKRDNGFEKSEVEARVDTFINVAGGGKEVVKEEGEKVAGSVEETTDRAAVSLEVTGESLLETILTQEDVDGALEETEGDLEAGKTDSEEQVVLIVLKNATERETQDGEETPATVEVAVGVQPEQEKEEESKAGLGVVDEEQTENSRRKEAALLEISQTDHTDGEKALPHPNDHVIQIKPVFGEPIKEEKAGRREENMDELEKPDDNGLVEREKTEAEGTDLRTVKVEAKYGEVVIKEGSVALVVEGGDNAEEEEQIALEDSEDNKEDQAALVIPGPQSEESRKDSTEKRPENQPSTTNPSFGAGTTEYNTLTEVKSNHQSRTITSNPGFLPHNHGRIQPTLDKFENNIFAEYHQEKGEKPNGIRDAVEVTPGKTDKNEQGLEAWKTGAIFTAVFLVLETVVIVIYVLKCRNKKSTPAVQQACEEACVEPETEMGGDCSDDTLTEDNENSQEITRLDPSDVASALAIEREKQKDEDVVAMSNRSLSSIEMLPSPGPGLNSLQDIRTSI
ncbi:putative surface protein SACOL0050 [Gambusia affinis]|uniref:putative surface protein SACOL0050 n=1 Tax=Gambusia affinis TaxID=33528 RepID=UPI001CDB93B2|nr:putative surface protein SACOL0050 [Gambusia affinis]